MYEIVILPSSLPVLGCTYNWTLLLWLLLSFSLIGVIFLWMTVMAQLVSVLLKPSMNPVKEYWNTWGAEVIFTAGYSGVRFPLCLLYTVWRETFLGENFCDWSKGGKNLQKAHWYRQIMSHTPKFFLKKTNKTLKFVKVFSSRYNISLYCMQT